MNSESRKSDVRCDSAPAPVGPYPHARRVGEFLFLSGIGPRKAGSKEIPGVIQDKNGVVTSWDIEIQARAVFENVRLILEAAGSSWDRIVDVHVFLTDMKRDFATFNRVYGEYFRDPTTQPTRTTVEISALPTPIAVELKIIAVSSEYAEPAGEPD